ncbi:Uncharacterised protein [Vibrio cholerae]|nr:Uncharacterised protein [Vibrio cholerae]
MIQSSVDESGYHRVLRSAIFCSPIFWIRRLPHPHQTTSLNAGYS